MHNNQSEKKTTPANVSRDDGQDSGLGIGSRVAPAVALLMLGDSVYAGDTTSDQVTVPEPSALSLLAVGAVVVGTARYIQNKRRK